MGRGAQIFSAPCPDFPKEVRRLKRQFALARHKYSFYDPLSNVHLTVDKPISRVIDDTQVDVRRLERAVRLGSLIDLTPKQEKASNVAPAPKATATAKESEKVDKEVEKEQVDDKADTEVASDPGEDGKKDEQEGVDEKPKAKASAAKKQAAKDK